MQSQQAETLALQALQWLADDDELCGLFLGSSGLAVADLHAAAGDSAFLGSVLDFVLMRDDWVIRFCDACDLAYDAPMRARQMLPGGEVVNWT